VIVVDSSVWIDYFSGKKTAETEALDALLGDEPVAIGDLMLTEVLQGFKSDREFRLARELLLALTVVNILDTTIALKSADNYRELRKRGITVPKTIDCIIASWCVENGFALLHSDKDFQPFHQYLGLQNALNIKL
jgi:predicted nucleic acid-binding protein